jgi:hypothetical protein
MRKKTRLGGAGALYLAALTAFGMAREAAAQSYRHMTCGELWYARNQIYADEGYCFKTDDAIRVFGEGCFPPYGRLTKAEKQDVEEIKKWERRKGC